MYKENNLTQMTIEDFNQSCGTQLSPDNRWVVLAHRIDWDFIEKRYKELFPSKKGRPAINSRMGLAALIIQMKEKCSDRELERKIVECPYYQYFMGLKKFQSEPPLRHGVLPELRKRFSMEFVAEINEKLLQDSTPTNEHINDKPDTPTENGNLGDLILDASCSPANISYPQDFALLNEGREKLEDFIDYLYKNSGDTLKPRTYRKTLRKEFLSVSKSKKKTTKKIRSLIHKLLCAINRNLKYIDDYLDRGLTLKNKQCYDLLDTIRLLYSQQREMFETNKHSIPNRIVSISQPHIRPIVRGKAKAPVEFGIKYQVSINEKGHARLDTTSFEPFNEGKTLIDATEQYKAITGHYPKRLLADKIYQTKENRAYCEEHGIKLSGRGPGRPSCDSKINYKIKKENRQCEIDRQEVERFFSLGKRCYGAALITTKLSETTLARISLCVLVANLFGTSHSFFAYYFAEPREDLDPISLLIIED